MARNPFRRRFKIVGGGPRGRKLSIPESYKRPETTRKIVNNRNRDPIRPSVSEPYLFEELPPEFPQGAGASESRFVDPPVKDGIHGTVYGPKNLPPRPDDPRQSR